MTEKFLKDVLSTALEGGINYWAEVRGVVREADGNYISAEVRDSEEPTDPWLTLDTRTVRLGIEGIAAGAKAGRAAEILDASARNDAGDIDAFDADAICQVGLFGEVVFG